ncbi:MAG: hypothetical protein NTW18_01670 [Candidatus Omnitrophica bacterium]|nr:hypothetical protein [Candidatus Omnitrophota bacterium]
MKIKKFNIIYGITHIFTYHPWLKIVSLILALILWLYIKEEMLIFQ